MMENFIIAFISFFIVFVFIYIVKRDEDQHDISLDRDQYGLPYGTRMKIYYKSGNIQYYEIWDNWEIIEIIENHINNLTIAEALDIVHSKIKQREDITTNG